MIDDIEPSVLKKKEVIDQGSITVLIAEDDDSSFVLLDVILKGKYKIIRVSNSQDIVEHMDRYEPNVLLADADMPGFDDELISKLRENHRNIPIIGISDNIHDIARKKEMSDIFDGHLTKPINIKSLMSILEEKLKNS